MKIENVTLETKIRYVEDSENAYNHSKSIDILEIAVPLPGGKAIYEIPLNKGIKDSLEFAAKLAERGV